MFLSFTLLNTAINSRRRFYVPKFSLGLNKRFPLLKEPSSRSIKELNTVYKYALATLLCLSLLVPSCHAFMSLMARACVELNASQVLRFGHQRFFFGSPFLCSPKITQRSTRDTTMILHFQVNTVDFSFVVTVTDRNNFHSNHGEGTTTIALLINCIPAFINTSH